jgi:hypothetical protein
MAVGMINGTSALGQIADPPGGTESEGVPPNNGLQTDAPKAARA